MLELDPVLLFGIALAGAPLARGAPWALALVAVAAVGVARRRGLAFALITLGLGLGGWRANRELVAHAAEVRALAAVAPAPTRCEGEGVIVRSPVVVRGALRLVVEFAHLECEGATLPPLWAVLYSGEASDLLARGDRVEATVAIAPLERFADVELGDGSLRRARGRVMRSGGALALRRTEAAVSLVAAIDRARAHVRRRIEATFPSETAPLARALVLGETDLAHDDDAAFRTSGLAHLLAVSGMHLVIVVVGFVRLLAATLARVSTWAARFDTGRAAAAVGIAASWLYADFAGGSGSALRAAWMLTFALAARALARRSDPSRCFGLSVIAMALVDPLVVTDVSFVLSAAATLGLLVLARPIATALRARLPAILGFVADSAGATTAATLPCAPILLGFAPTVPLGGILANLIAVPLGEAAALPICILHIFLSPLPGAERGAALAASGALSLVRGVARGFASARVLSLALPPPTAFELAVLGVGALLAAAMRGRGRAGAILGSILALAGAESSASAHATGELRVSFLDVGQGDAALIDLPDGQAMLVDGGGLVGSPVDVGERVLAPVLRARRRRRLALVVLSHPHPDHYGGFGAGLADVRVDEIWDTGQGEREGVGGAYASFLDRAKRGARLLRPNDLCGAPRDVGGARLEVLAPCPGPSPDRGPNDNSLVVRITHGTRSVVFVGDAEREEEEDLVAHGGGLLRADVLKVGHHGSRTSSSAELVRAVGPRVAVISVGARNRFGHPAAATLATLASAGARVFRTDRDGEVVVRTDGRSLSVTAPAADDL